MKTRYLVFSAIIIMMWTNNVKAQVRQRAKNQHARIVQGVKSVELTPAETKNLVKKEKDIRQDVREAKADGVITPAERKDIRQDQRKASRVGCVS